MMVMDGVDRDAVKPFEERLARSKPADVPEDLDEGVLAGVERVVPRQSHLHPDRDDPALVEAHETSEGVRVPCLGPLHQGGYLRCLDLDRLSGPDRGEGP